MPFDFGFNFRDTEAYTTDDSFAAFTRTEAYPHTYTNDDGKSINAGWVTGSVAAQDAGDGNDPTIDSRVDGNVYISAGDSATFRVDLNSGSAPGAGEYEISAAWGASGPRAWTAIFVKDDTVAVIGPSGDLSILSGALDATFSEYEQSLWDNFQEPVTVTFETTTVVVGFTANGNFASMAHFRLTLIAAAGGGAVQYRRRRRA